MIIVYNTRMKSVDAEIIIFSGGHFGFFDFFTFPPVSSNGTFFGKTGISQDNIAVKIISVRILSRSTSRSTSLLHHF